MENEIVYIKLDDIIPNRFQPREVFEEGALQKLADSIKQHGVIEPIIVRPISNKYEIIAGERRYKASVLAGLTKIPAIIKPMDDKESSIIAYIENEHRSDVSAIEEARTIDRILKSNNMTQEELAKELGVNQSTIANKLRLLGLPTEIQDALMHNEISERHARSLLSVKDEAKQIELLQKIKERKMSVRELDSEIKSMNNGFDNINNSVNNDFGGLNNSFLNQPSSAPSTNDFSSFLNPSTSTSTFSPVPPIDSAPLPSTNSSFNEYLNPPTVDKSSTPSSTTGDIDFMNFLNSYDDKKPAASTPVDPAPQAASTSSSTAGDIDFMDFLNSYDDKKPAASTSVEPTTSEAPKADNDADFMDFLNNYDLNNPLPDTTSDEEPSSNGGLNIGEYLNEKPTTTSSTIDYDFLNDISSTPTNNVVLNDVKPPITAPTDANSYIEKSDSFVDVSKKEVIGSVDEIIDKLKVVVDDIKTKSKFKVDTDEINYDDIYQITIRIDKRDF